jgi:DNA mismatch repair protein MutL
VAQVFEDEALLGCEGTRGPLHVLAFLSRPERARQGALGLKLIVNGRTVRDRALAATVAHAYGSILERGRYPRGALYLDLPGRLIDVNVHPQKVEVRFAEPRPALDAVYSIVSRSLGPGLSATPGNTVEKSPAPSDLTSAPGGASSTPHASPWSHSTASSPHPAAPSVLRDRSPPVSGVRYERAGSPTAQESAQPSARAHAHADELAAATGQLGFLVEEPSSAPAQNPAEKVDGSWKNLTFLNQVRHTFLLCEGDDGLYVLDQHAAAERVIFSKLSRSYQARSIATQALLFPVLCDITPRESEVLEQRRDDIFGLGLDVRIRTPEQASVHGIPKILTKQSPERLLRDLLRELARSGERAYSGAVDKVLATMACHAAVRAGDAISAVEAQSLLSQLDVADFAGYCPHGRPIVAFTSWLELERKVGRR